MNDEIRKCLTKILVSIDSIGSYLINNRSFQVYQTNNALRLNPELSISNSRRIVDTRNRIIHSYDAVNDTVVWSIVIKHLPVLKNEIVQLLEITNDSKS
jgi:hypothetical protein